MPKKEKSEDIHVDHWQEVFNSIEIRSIPIEYLLSLDIHFHDGTSWNVSINHKSSTIEEIENDLDALIDEYDDDIKTIEFRLDTERVKKDVTKRTHRFLKKGK